jgi:hypothetical protein
VRRSVISLLAATLAGTLLTGTSRNMWNASWVEEGPNIELDTDLPSVEFNIDLALDMCEPGPEGEPVQLFMDLNSGFDAVNSSGLDSASLETITVSLYPADGSPQIAEIVDLSGGSAGSSLTTGNIQCPAFGRCERSYVVVFEASDGTLATGWWTLTAAALGPSQSEGVYQGEISIEISER